MAEYLGLHAIAKRMSTSVPRVRRLHAEEGLLLFRRRMARVGPGRRRWCWATTDELLTAWLIAKCAADRQHIPPGLASRANRHVAEESRGR